MSKEIGICIFPTCTRKEEKAGYCFLHKIYSDMPAEKKVLAPLPKVSAKRKQENKQYKKIIKAQFKEDNRCKVNSPDCTGEMEGMNHAQKRSPKNLLDRKNLTPCCNACNRYIENNIDWAKAHGHFVSRFEPKVLIASHDRELNTTIIEEAQIVE